MAALSRRASIDRVDSWTTAQRSADALSKVRARARTAPHKVAAQRQRLAYNRECGTRLRDGHAATARTGYDKSCERVAVG